MNAAGEPIVSVRNLSVWFGDFAAVKNVSFSVQRGEVFGFLGANGAGKTTTIRVLCGLLPPTSGEIEMAGEKFSQAGATLKTKVGYMSQRFTLYDDLTVGENLSFAADLHRLPRLLADERRTGLLDFIGWNRSQKTMVRDLPGGQKQQVSLVAALMHDPELVFLDEPTAGVSPASRARFWDLIRQLAARGKTVFVTTHYMDEAEQCGRIALMRSGELVALDSPRALEDATFPNGLVELQSKGTVTLEDIRRIRSEGWFPLFEPYGLRYHAELPSAGLNRNQEAWLHQHMQIRPIRPSLEDVFIRIVEGKER